MDLRSRHWFLTWNNYVKAGPDKSIDVLLAIGGLIKYVIQEEKGDEGTPHLQGVMSFRSAKKWSTLRRHAKIYWKPCRNVMAAKNYCSKLETSTGHCWNKGYSVKKKKLVDPLEGKKLYKWQLEIVNLAESIPDDRKIYWYWSDKGGIGKSALVKHLVMNNDAILIGGSWRDAYYAIAQRVDKDKEVELLIFDLPRSQGNKISYTAIEGIKNGCFFSAKYESEMCVFNTPHIIVMANFTPDREFLSEDRWEVKCLDDLL